MDDAKLTASLEALEGTCQGLDAIAEDFGVTIEVLEERMLDLNLERCPHCDWWCECSELINAEGDLVGCDDCCPKYEEDK